MTDFTTPTTQTTTSAIALTLRAEAAVLGVFSILAYGWLGGSWGLFALLILAPDLAMVGYGAGKRIGALCYNLAHSLIGPTLLALLGAGTGMELPLQIALIWAAHIWIDRAIGYGLKYASGFKQTHLGRV